MKKVWTVCMFFLLLALFIFNPSEVNFKEYFANSSANDLTTAQEMQKATPIMHTDHRFFSPFCNIDRTNLLLFSIYTIDYGWSGNLRFDGSPIDKDKIDGGGEIYRGLGTIKCLSILNNHFRISNSFEKNWK